MKTVRITAAADFVINVTPEFLKGHKVVAEELAASIENESAVLRTMLFQSRLGHPEHHPTWGCERCADLRDEIKKTVEESL